ncbi:MAG TPA: ATP-binding protein [Dongiaceae bacterium]|nr:ATP-binding protein [Dongiaceae bacterium]
MSRGARRQSTDRATSPQNAAQHVSSLIAGPFSDFVAPMAIYGLDDQLLWSTGSYNQLLRDAAEQASFADLLHPSRWLDLSRLQTDGIIWRDGAIDLGGKDHLLQARFAPLLNDTGALTAIASVIQVTPNLARMSRDLLRMQERLTDVIRLASDWVWETDVNLNLTFLSERVAKIMGYYPAELIGKPLHALALNRRAGRTLLKRIDTLTPFRDHVFEAVDKAGQLKLLLVSVVPIFDPDNGAHLGFRGTANDVTELTERERNLLAAKEAAEQANRAKTHFLAHMSHELRTPLNSIIGFSEMMRLQTHGPLGAPEYVSYAEDIHGSANQLLTVINDILGLTSVEAGTLVLQDAETTLEMIAEPVVAAFRAKAEQAGIALSCDFGGELPHLMVDQRVARQILGNLLSNAIKFTPRGGRVELRAGREADGALSITISDTGIGISEEMIEHIFMPFFQAEAGTTRKFEGTGLGLALSKRLAELIGGTLSIASTQGLGTKVSLCLPAERLVLTGI